MALKRKDRWVRAVQVGRLMRDYRQHSPRKDGGKGLTQKQVLDRMAEFSDPGAMIHSDTTLGRLERAEILPSRQRLETFGKALNLSQVEVDGLIVLAGFELDSQQVAQHPVQSNPYTDRRQAPGAVQPDAGAVCEETVSAGAEAASVVGEDGSRSFLADALNLCFFRFLLPVVAVAGGGYLLSSLKVATIWMLMLYIGLAMGLVLSQGLFKMRRADSLRDLLFVTLFIVLSTGLLQVPFIGMDPYGFYIWGEPGGIVLPILLSLMANLLVSLIASLMFDLSWRWQYSGRGADKAYMRSLWVAVPPMAFTYAWVLLTGNWGAWIGCSVMLTILAGVFAMLTVMRDETVKFTEWDRRFLLWCSMQITTVLAALGAVSIAVGYMDPSLLSLSGHTLIHPWEIDYAALGYSESELIARLRVGYAWNSITCISYLVIVIGSYVTLNIYRLGGGDPAVPTADVGELPAGTSRERSSRKERIKALLGPGGLAGYPLHPEPA